MPSRLKPHAVPLLILLAMTFIVYASSLGHDFLINWDDNSYVTDNKVIRGFSPENLKAAFSTCYAGNYAPLHIISYMLDYSLWGLKPFGFVLTNILLHAVNGVFLYLLIIKISGRKLWAFLAGFIFLFHPLQVESVSWISQRKNVLSMFFFLISFLLYIAYWDSGLGTRDSIAAKNNSKLKTQNSKLFYASSLAAFACALLSKSVAVILPLLLLAYDFCFIEKGERKGTLLDKIPFILAAALISLIAILSHAPELDGGRSEYYGGTPLNTFLTMLPVFSRYLGMLFWPVKLSAVYNPSIKTGIDGAVLLSMLPVLGILILAFLWYRRRNGLLFWLSVFLIGFLPVSQIVPLVTLMNDRYIYFPMLGAAPLIAGAMVSGVDALSGPYRKTATAIICMLLISLPVMSFYRSKAWQDSMTLWSDAYAKVPDSEIASWGLGESYYRAGNLKAALPFYEKTHAAIPMQRDPLHNLAILYLDLGEYGKAEPLLLNLVLGYHDFAMGYVTLGRYYFLTGDMRNAEAACNKALKLQPGSGPLLAYLGYVYFENGQIDRARKYYQDAVERGEETKDSFYSLAALEASVGDTPKALAYAGKAFKLEYRKGDAIMKDRKLALLKRMPEFQRLLQIYALN